jgi:hypothetical protein
MLSQPSDEGEWTFCAITFSALELYVVAAINAYNPAGDNRSSCRNRTRVYTLLKSVLRAKDRTELMPRRKISYVSAKDQVKLAYIVAAIVCFLVAIAITLNDPSAAQRNARPIVLALIVGVIFFIAYFGSRRVGIVIASSGGKLFVETRGKDRLAILANIHRDLQQNSAAE